MRCYDFIVLGSGIAGLSFALKVASQWEKAVVHLGRSIAGRICRQQLKLQPDITVTLTREALEMAAGSPQIEVRLNPTDFESLGAQSERLASTFAAAADVRFVAAGDGGFAVPKAMS